MQPRETEKCFCMRKCLLLGGRKLDFKAVPGGREINEERATGGAGKNGLGGVKSTQEAQELRRPNHRPLIKKRGRKLSCTLQ